MTASTGVTGTEARLNWASSATPLDAWSSAPSLLAAAMAGM